MQFPTGGIVRDLRLQLNRCNSGTDSIVWMREENENSLQTVCMLRNVHTDSFFMDARSQLTVLMFSRRIPETGGTYYE